MRLVTAALTVLLSACAAPIVTTSAAPSPTVTTTATPTIEPTPTRSATPSPQPTPTFIGDLSQVFAPITTNWRPTGPTLLFANNEGDRSVLVGVPFGPNGATGPAVRLVTLLSQGGWDLRGDGGAIVTAVY